MGVSEISPAQIAAIRAQISTGISHPLVLAIVSAKPNDGTRLLAHLLAKSFHEDVEQTLVVEFSQNVDGAFVPVRRAHKEEMRRDIDMHIRSGSKFSPDTITMYAPEGGTIWSAQIVTMLIEILTARYAYVLVDAAQPMKFSNAFLWAMGATKVVISVQHGRSICADDRQLSARAGFGEKIVGVVSLDAKLIQEFPIIQSSMVREMSTVKGDFTPAKTLVERV